MLLCQYLAKLPGKLARHWQSEAGASLTAASCQSVLSKPRGNILPVRPACLVNNYKSVFSSIKIVSYWIALVPRVMCTLSSKIGSVFFVIKRNFFFFFSWVKQIRHSTWKPKLLWSKPDLSMILTNNWTEYQKLLKTAKWERDRNINEHVLARKPQCLLIPETLKISQM